ncbi:meiotic nuclear division protein 1, partial [Mucidula mucida]
STVFWSFPSQQGSLVQSRLKEAQDQRTTNQAQIAEVRNLIKVLIASIPQDTRTHALAELNRLKKELVQLDNELSAYSACDPVKLDETRRGILLAKEAAIRWTENFCIALAHFQRQSLVEPSEIRRYLGVNDDYEDIC